MLPQSSSRSPRLIAAVAAACLAAIAGTVAAQPAAAAKPILGPDVSSYQHPSGDAINWKQVATSGASFAIVKATEGTGYTNPYFAADYAGIGQAGLVAGSYHFARPALPIASTAQAQATYFASKVGAVNTKNTLPPALDLEVTGGLGRSQLIRWAQDFLLDLRNATGRTPLLYTYPSFWTDTLADPAAFARYPIWMASYTSSLPSGATLWQFTSSASVKGIVGHVDMSRYVGTTAWPWSTVSDGTVASPWPAAAPGAPQNVSATLNANDQAVVSWLPGDSGSTAINGFTVTSSTGTTQSVPAGATSATISGLKPGISYSFTVTARNSVGAGPPSSPSNAVELATPTSLVGTATTSIAFGQQATVSATLTKSTNNGALAGRAVTLSREVEGVTSFTPVASLTTDAQGRVSSIRSPHKNTTWKLTFAPNGPYAGSTTTLQTLVKPVVSAALTSSSAEPGAWVHLTGSLTPKPNGVVLTRQVLVNGTWTNAQHKSVSTPDYEFSFRAPASGPVKYRVFASPADGRAGALSRAVSLTVSPTS
jgi:GH25 family lysozyme M1 (1,4-beta-N-acetylmuramidase)